MSRKTVVHHCVGSAKLTNTPRDSAAAPGCVRCLQLQLYDSGNTLIDLMKVYQEEQRIMNLIRYYCDACKAKGWKSLERESGRQY